MTEETQPLFKRRNVDLLSLPLNLKLKITKRHNFYCDFPFQYRILHVYS